MIQYSLLGRSAASVSGTGCLRMGTEPVPETLYLNELRRLIAREDCIESNMLRNFTQGLRLG